MVFDPVVTTLLLLFAGGLIVAARHELDERRWRRERDAADRTAAE
jgi:hypothetical protein